MRLFLDAASGSLPSTAPGIEHARTEKPSPPMSIPWTNWGPMNTRWFEQSWRQDGQPTIFSLRTVEWLSEDIFGTEWDGRFRVESGGIWDWFKTSKLRLRGFNPHAVRMAIISRVWMRKEDVLSESLRQCAQRAFEDNIIYFLPYTEIVSTKSKDECRILLYSRFLSHLQNSFFILFNLRRAKRSIDISQF